MVDNVIFGHRHSVEMLIGEIAVPEDAVVGVARDLSAVQLIQGISVAVVDVTGCEEEILVTGFRGVEVHGQSASHITTGERLSVEYLAVFAADHAGIVGCSALGDTEGLLSLVMRVEFSDADHVAVTQSCRP